MRQVLMSVHYSYADMHRGLGPHSHHIAQGNFTSQQIYREMHHIAKSTVMHNLRNAGIKRPNAEGVEKLVRGVIELLADDIRREAIFRLEDLRSIKATL